tara:strand:- start:270 stop:545 length:276 start_codon:yes stop_codon:yes gene_type:complete
MDEITANSTEANASVTAAFDSVNLIDAIVAGTSDIESAADKANSADCNYRHLEIMLEKSWFAGTLTSAQKTDVDAAIVAGNTYWAANSASA